MDYFGLGLLRYISVNKLWTIKTYNAGLSANITPNLDTVGKIPPLRRYNRYTTRRGYTWILQSLFRVIANILGIIPRLLQKE